MYCSFYADNVISLEPILSTAKVKEIVWLIDEYEYEERTKGRKKKITKVTVGMTL